MTAKIELLPLYAELQGHPKLEIVKHYARANVAHATAANGAEIETLRAEIGLLRHGNVAYSQQVADLIGRAGSAEARAERLAEALRHSRWCRTCAEDGWESCEDGRKNEALLNPTAAQENDDA